MATPEGKVKTWIDGLMKKWFPGAWRYCPPGIGYFGNNGQPDRVYLWRPPEFDNTELPGIFIAIEAKAPGGTPTKLQLERLKEIKRNGGVAAIVVGKDIVKMEAIRNAVLSRVSKYVQLRSVSMADEESGSQAVHASAGDNRVSDS